MTMIFFSTRTNALVTSGILFSTTATSFDPEAAKRRIGVTGLELRAASAARPPGSRQGDAGATPFFPAIWQRIFGFSHFFLVESGWVVHWTHIFLRMGQQQPSNWHSFGCRIFVYSMVPTEKSQLFREALKREGLRPLPGWRVWQGCGWCDRCGTSRPVQLVCRLSLLAGPGHVLCLLFGLAASTCRVGWGGWMIGTKRTQASTNGRSSSGAAGFVSQLGTFKHMMFSSSVVIS